MGNGQAANLDGLTIARIRGFYEVLLDGATTSSAGGYGGAFGICVVSINAFAIGIMAVPAPITDIAWEGWLWHEFFSVHVGDSTAGDRSPNVIRKSFDTKGMRKLGSNQTVACVIEVEEAGADTMVAFVGSRMLLYLP